MILDPTHDLSTCNDLYKRTVRSGASRRFPAMLIALLSQLYLQNHVEAPVWFPVKSQFKIYLSGGSLYRAYAGTLSSRNASISH